MVTRAGACAATVDLLGTSGGRMSYVLPGSIAAGSLGLSARPQRAVEQAPLALQDRCHERAHRSPVAWLRVFVLMRLEFVGRRGVWKAGPRIGDAAGDSQN